jgi:DNA-binding transcriptional ArsR family regulator
MQTIALAEVAAVLADRARAAMCLALIDGRAWTVGELARAAGIAPSTASEQVSKLVASGFVESLRQGRHRYIRITDPHVAELIERLSEHAERRPVTGLRASIRARRLAVARTCYDHLAGRLGVAVRDGMIDRGLLDVTSGLALTGDGRRVLDGLGVRIPKSTNRPLLRDCLDWTERREHLAGTVGAALLDRALAAGWVERGPDRSVKVRDAARQPMSALGVDLDKVSSTPGQPAFTR